MDDEEAGTDLVQGTGFQGDVQQGKQNLAQINDLLLERCNDSTDANNVAARFHVALKATAHFLSDDAAQIDESVLLGQAAFLAYQTGSPRRTRPRHDV